MAVDKKDFFLQVHQVAKLIPKGRVSTYGAIAEYLGAKKSARVVGYAMNAAHVDDTIPAHRVVNRNGMLSGKMHFSYPDQMQELLELEGHRVIEDKLQNFKEILWLPMEELE